MRNKSKTSFNSKMKRSCNRSRFILRGILIVFLRRTAFGRFKRSSLLKVGQVSLASTYQFVVYWDDIYRFRHIGTGKYLCVSPEKLELSLKLEADSIDTLFRIRRESYHPGSQTIYEYLKSGENILLENYWSKFI